jgi:hypothetical protein
MQTTDTNTTKVVSDEKPLTNKCLDNEHHKTCSNCSSMASSTGQSAIISGGAAAQPRDSAVPILGSANAPTILALIVAFSSVATVYASVNSGVHRITWLALLCLTCTGSVAFMLAVDFLCRLPSTKFFGAVLRQRVTHIADNWQRHTVRSYLEVCHYSAILHPLHVITLWWHA